MIKRYALLCNLLVLTIACYVWGNGRGQFYAVGTSAPKGTQFDIYVDGAFVSWFTQLNRRFSAGKVPANGRVEVWVSNELICTN